MFPTLILLPGLPPLTPSAYEELSIGAVETPLTPALAQECRAAIGRLDNGPVRYLYIGHPTAGVGHILYDGDPLTLNNAEARQITLIRTGVTNGLLRITYYN
jgi:hypothetical protein